MATATRHDLRRNIGILAHVDAGKTTLTERMLFEAGALRAVGSVDEGTAHTDFLPQERERGISILAASAVVPWREHQIHLIDTPGHTDFSAEVERALAALDAAVLVVSGSDGVQAHTDRLWRALSRRGLPVMLFVNKLDLVGADFAAAVSQIQAELSADALPVTRVEGREQTLCGAVFDVAPLAAEIAARDEVAFDRYTAGGQLAPPFLRERLAALTRTRAAFPVAGGAAARGIGVRELLDAVVDLLPPPVSDPDAPFSAVVFKVERQRATGRLTHVRIFSGAVRARDEVPNATRGGAEKVSQVRRRHADKLLDVGAAGAGEIAVLAGLNAARIGDVLGAPGITPGVATLDAPLYAVRVHPITPDQAPALAEALQQLDDEDPALGWQWHPEIREMHLNLMGPVQLEILESILRDRFGLTARFDPPTVIHRETPVRGGTGYVAYTEPIPCFAILRFRIEPGPRGSGLRYHSVVAPDDCLLRYQNQVERTVPQALRHGPLGGWPVTDLEVTLIEGRHHLYHTHPLDFIHATPMGIMDALRHCEMALLEPILWLRVSAPHEVMGRVLGDLAQMEATFDTPQTVGGRFTVEGKVPAATSLSYPLRLARLTAGRGYLTLELAEWRPVPDARAGAQIPVAWTAPERPKRFMRERG